MERGEVDATVASESTVQVFLIVEELPVHGVADSIKKEDHDVHNKLLEEAATVKKEELEAGATEDTLEDTVEIEVKEEALEESSEVAVQVDTNLEDSCVAIR